MFPWVSCGPLIWPPPGFTREPCVETADGVVRGSAYAEAEAALLLGGGRGLESILLTIFE